MGLNRELATALDSTSRRLAGRRARTRTWDPLLRRQMLYPTELRARDTFIVKHRQIVNHDFDARVRSS